MFKFKPIEFNKNDDLLNITNTFQEHQNFKINKFNGWY